MATINLLSPRRSNEIIDKTETAIIIVLLDLLVLGILCEILSEGKTRGSGNRPYKFPTFLLGRSHEMKLRFLREYTASRGKFRKKLRGEENLQHLGLG